MNIIYFGSSGFSVPPLRSIAASVRAVVTKRAKPRGRGYLLEDNEVKQTAADLQLPIIEIGSFRDEEARSLMDLKPDLFIVASFGLIIPGWALELPSVGPVNVHPSLLPKYRGPSPIQWALLNGDRETGITLIRMSERMDAGNILYQEKAVVGAEDDVITLSERLSQRVAGILPQYLDEIDRAGLPQGVPQNEEEATYTPIITKEMGKIDWTRPAAEIGRQVKAFVSWPVAYTTLDKLILRVFRCRAIGGKSEDMPGTVTSAGKGGVVVSTGEGLLLLEEVQLENKKRMTAQSFAQGFRRLEGKVLGQDVFC